MITMFAVLVVVIVVAFLSRSRTAAIQTHSERLRAIEVGTRRWRMLGLLTGVGGVGAAVSTGGLGRGILLAAPIFGLGVLVGVVVGELRVVAPGGPTRCAARPLPPW